MSTRTTLLTVFVLGFITGALVILMLLDRTPEPPDTEAKYQDWRRPMATPKRRPA